MFDFLGGVKREHGGSEKPLNDPPFLGISGVKICEHGGGGTGEGLLVRVGD